MQDILIKALEEQDTLCHHGILGQKWEVRRYQNPDGSLTEEGRKRYSKLQTKADKRANYVKQNYAKAEDVATKNPSAVKVYGTYASDQYTAYRDNAARGLRAYDRVSDKMSKFGQSPSSDEKLEEIRKNLTTPTQVKSQGLQGQRWGGSPSTFNSVASTMENSGWSVDKSGGFGGDIYATSKAPFGSKSITFSTIIDPGDVYYYSDKVAKELSNVKSKMNDNNREIINQCKKAIVEQIYDSNENLQRQISRNDFANSIKPYAAHINGNEWSDLVEISFEADGIGGHSLDIEFNLKNMKPASSGVAMNG